LVKKDEFVELTADIKNSQPTDAFNLVTIIDTINCNGVRNILTFIPDECKYDLLDLRFLALYLKHDDKSHIIDLYQENSNYYVTGNVINSAFLKYYLKNVLSVEIDNSKPFVYTLELMDHNVQMVYLDETQSIVFQKDGYIIEDGTKILSIAEESKVEEIKMVSVAEEDYDDLPELIDIIEETVKNVEEPVIKETEENEKEKLE